MVKTRAIFLDRDGTLIRDIGYPKDPNQVELIDGASTSLLLLREHGFLLIVISNQSGIGRHRITADEANRVHRRMLAKLEEQGVQIEGAYYCPHAPEESCCCRKPSPVMLQKAVEEFGVDLVRSYMVGDKPSDIEAGKRAGCRTILLLAHTDGCSCDPPPDYTASDWPDVVNYIVTSRETTA